MAGKNVSNMTYSVLSET